MNARRVWQTCTFLWWYLQWLRNNFCLCFFAFSICPCIFCFSIPFSTPGRKGFSIGLPSCWINFAPSLNCISTSMFFTVWFSIRRLINLCLSVVLFRSFVFSGLFMWLMFVMILPDSSVFPNFPIQLSQSSGCVFLVVINNSSCCFVRSSSTFAVVFLRFFFCCC